MVWLQGPDFEAKVAKLVELGFGRDAVIQALKFFDGNEEQAAGYLFGGWLSYIPFKIHFIVGIIMINWRTQLQK